jgi:hypothetical protein
MTDSVAQSTTSCLESNALRHLWRIELIRYAKPVCTQLECCKRERTGLCTESPDWVHWRLSNIKDDTLIWGPNWTVGSTYRQWSIRDTTIELRVMVLAWAQKYCGRFAWQLLEQALRTARTDIVGHCYIDVLNYAQISASGNKPWISPNCAVFDWVPVARGWNVSTGRSQMHKVAFCDLIVHAECSVTSQPSQSLQDRSNAALSMRNNHRIVNDINSL